MYIWDVWTNPEQFKLDKNGKPLVVAGVPPDYFSTTGQLWGNPLYNWERMQADGFKWWIERVRATLTVVDIARAKTARGTRSALAAKRQHGAMDLGLPPPQHVS